MNETYSSVVKIIKDYVYTCGGDVTVPELIEDYYKSFHSEIPYEKFGHNTLIDFLISITGLSVIIYNEEYHIQTKWSKSTSSSESTHSKLSSDMSLLCIEMQNNLHLADSDTKRKVTLKSGSLLKHSKNQLPERYNYSVKSEEYVPSSGYLNGTYSTTHSRFDLNSSYRTSNDRSDYSVDSFELNKFIPVTDHDVYPSSTPHNHGYDSELPQPYIPQSAFYDSSLIYQNQLSNSNLFFGNNRKNIFFEQDPSVKYDILYSSFDKRDDSNFNVLHESLPVSEKQVVNRLVVLINAHQKKITSSAVEFNYIDSYSDALPKNWLALLEESSHLYIEHLTAGTMIYPNRTFSTTPTISDLPKLDFPYEMPWSVVITFIRSTDSVWFRLIDNELDRRYQILCDQMRKHYQDLLPGKVASVGTQQLFVAKLKNKPVRVCVLDGQNNGTCKCLAIDEGVVEIFPLTSLMSLHEKFTNTPKLILQGSLVGLSKYAECSHIRHKLVKMVIGVETSVVVEKFEGEKFMMNLFVTKSYDSVNVNEYLLDVVKKELSLPKFEINRMYEVVAISISITGIENTAKVQIKSPSYDLLQDSLRKCKHIIDCTDQRLLFAKNVIDVHLNELYLAKYSDGSWQRVLLKQFVNSTHVVVVFVDFQDIQALEITKIISYTNFPDALTYIPPQGVNVTIVKTDLEVLKLMNHKLKTNLFSMKVVQTDPKLYVQMYLRVPEESHGEHVNGNKQFCCSAV